MTPARPSLRIVSRFREGVRYVVELERPNGKRVWVEGATRTEAEERAKAEIAGARP